MITTIFAALQVLLLIFLFAASSTRAFPIPAVLPLGLDPNTSGGFKRCKGNSDLTSLYAVTFRYSSSSFDHLKALDDDKQGKATTTASSETSNSGDDASSKDAAAAAQDTATVGALGCMAIVVGASLSFLPPEYETFSILLGAASAGIGYVALGGPEAQQASKPSDGGYDAKFVVDKPGRLREILQAIYKQKALLSSSTRSIKVIESESNGRDRSNALRLIQQVHGKDYIEDFQAAVEDSRTKGQARRLHPTIMRTLVDQHSFDAAVDGVADWIDAMDDIFVQSQYEHQTDNSIENGDGNMPERDIQFCLTRPPSHHACKSRGSGGCLLNGPAIAAMRALEGGASRIAILDIDAHHGNGIAHCVQDEERIRYCSIHEDVVEKNWFANANDVAKKEKSWNPRSPYRDDRGPLGNICNIPLPKGTTWETGYSQALLEEALPFLMKPVAPDILILAAGFDALAVDTSSKLALQPRDYRAIGEILQSSFGSNVIVGLEGGYVWKDGTLGNAVLELVQPWTKTR